LEGGSVRQPVRIQLSRKRGWRKLADYPSVMPEPEKRVHALRCFRGALTGEIEDPIHPLPFTIEDVRRELRGKNLACFCRLDQGCHADVLLAIAAGAE
jgi:hypothetical protein